MALLTSIQNHEGTKAERLALVTTKLPTGSTFKETDTGNKMAWNGAAWVVREGLATEANPAGVYIPRCVLESWSFGYNEKLDAIHVASSDEYDIQNNKVWGFNIYGSVAAAGVYRICISVPNEVTLEYHLKLKELLLVEGFDVILSKGSNSKIADTGSALDAIANMSTDSTVLPDSMAFKKGVSVADADPTDGTAIPHIVDSWKQLTINTQYTIKLTNNTAATQFFKISGMIKRLEV